MRKMPKNIYDALEHPKTCAPDDFWGQVRRTVHGKAIPQEQIDMIYGMIRDALRFEPNDVLLDLCCGNGALGAEFFDEVKEYLGVDMSPYLIEIAQKNFQRLPGYMFNNSLVDGFCRTSSSPERFTKALWFGAFSYFSDEEAMQVLSLLRDRFTGIKRLFVGNLPDIARTKDFWGEREIPDLLDHTSDIGKWRTCEEVAALAENAGWKCSVMQSPYKYYQAHYRFNVLLVPQG